MSRNAGKSGWNMRSAHHLISSETNRKAEGTETFDGGVKRPAPPTKLQPVNRSTITNNESSFPERLMAWRWSNWRGGSSRPLARSSDIASPHHTMPCHATRWEVQAGETVITWAHMNMPSPDTTHFGFNIRKTSCFAEFLRHNEIKLNKMKRNKTK